MYVAFLMEIGLDYEQIGRTTYKEQQNLIRGKNLLEEKRNKKKKS